MLSTQDKQEKSTAITLAPLRVMQVVAMLGEQPEGLSLNALCERAEIPKTSTLTLLKTLASGDYVVHDGGVYRLGRRMLQLAALIANGSTFPSNLSPLLKDLERAANQTAVLAEPDPEWSTLVYADVIEANSFLSFRVKVGAHRALHATAAGLALLAFAPPGIFERLTRHPLERLTSTTIVSSAALRRRLLEVRAQGYVVGDGSVENATGIAAPVFAPDRRLVASVGIVGVTNAITGSLPTYVELVKATAVRMSALLGVANYGDALSNPQ